MESYAGYAGADCAVTAPEGLAQTNRLLRGVDVPPQAAKRTIVIKGGLRGYIVEVGCQFVVFETKERLIQELERRGFRLTCGNGSKRKLYPPDRNMPFYSLHEGQGAIHPLVNFAKRNWNLDLSDFR